jgi:hypothetical protein
MYVGNYYLYYAGFEVLTAVVKKVAIFWDIVPCIPYITTQSTGCYIVKDESRRYL